MICIVIFLCTLVTSIDYFYFLTTCAGLIGLFGECLAYSSLVLSQEIVSNKKRSLFSSLINVGYALCGIIFTLIFLLFKDWRKVFYVLIGTSGLTLIIIWIFIYDSPREYINNKNYKKANEILEGIAKFNGKLESFRESVKNGFYENIMEDKKLEPKIEQNEKIPKTEDIIVLKKKRKKKIKSKRKIKRENDEKKNIENDKNKSAFKMEIEDKNYEECEKNQSSFKKEENEKKLKERELNPNIFKKENDDVKYKETQKNTSIFNKENNGKEYKRKKGIKEYIKKKMIIQKIQEKKRI